MSENKRGSHVAAAAEESTALLLPPTTGADARSNEPLVAASTKDSFSCGPSGSELAAKKDEGIKEILYPCSICRETAKAPVVTLCGHLYCFPCLYQWLECTPYRKLCPVCRTPTRINKNSLIPIYGYDETYQVNLRCNQQSQPSVLNIFQVLEWVNIFDIVISLAFGLLELYLIKTVHESRADDGIFSLLYFCLALWCSTILMDIICAIIREP